ncbi:response regulator [Paraburkholderia sp. RG36]|uniref:Response regulator n=2 Tax=Paraburkholderia tagetis TaxID=2913261 RepID=A0A9X1RUX1_9BURK|nr:response regulator [Paraburkholderia tagetis]
MRRAIIVPSHRLRASIDPDGDRERYLLRVAETSLPTRKMPSILLVDDQPELLDAYRLMLTAEGYAVRCAHNGVEALDHALRQPPDLIITDWMMPLMGGGELCRQIRAHPALAHIPILVHTAMPPSSPGPAQWDDLIKPVPAALLLATVKRWCPP